MKKVLDVACGPQSFYFDKEFPGLITMDKRKVDKIIYPENRRSRKRIKVNPDIVGDFRSIPFEDNTFYLVIFDPPHLKWTHKDSIMAETYGLLDSATWVMDIRQGFEECWRVLKPNGTLIFKWNEHDIKVKEVLEVLGRKPLIGNKNTRNGTHWLVFMKT